MEQAILQVTQCPEYYHGEPTGATQYRAELHWDKAPQEQQARLGGILGRSTTSFAGAVIDWNRRAADDGHQVNGLPLNAI